MHEFAAAGGAYAPVVTACVCAVFLATYPKVFPRHLTSNRMPAAEGFVSALSMCFAACVQVVGFFMHRASVAKHSLTFYGDSFSKVDIWN